MTTITKERLLTIKQWRETYGPGSNVVLSAEEAEELARIALTSIPEPMTEEKAYSNVQTSWQDAKYYTTGWNACRATMLHGAKPVSQTYKLNKLSGNYPVTPDGWISCSERMPNEEDVLVYCSDTKEQMVGFHKGKGLFQFFYMNGVEGVCEPSHWMPLPEPPQEVNRG
ncbi:TPA: DUF551 domain-containing protein [Escherichia coli]|nr:DUF551 domain-containing protein [Escherichia coli]HBA7893001.1 DUF551 domain-containing protein [Escherichia coli]HBA7907255.1 DUF551 domain-containing protein [Escherichia coli]